MSNITELHHFINGEHVPGQSGRQANIHNPATGEHIISLPLASKSEVETAIANAQAAFPGWAATPPAKRAQIMFNFRELVKSNMEDLAVLVSREHGKTIDDAKGSITRGLEVVEFACGAPQLLKGEHSPQVANGVDSYGMRMPMGVCAGITPFNFPAMVPMWMFPMALICGNTFVLKPSEKTPSCAMRLAELMIEAGLPKGVLNVVNGDKEAVDTLLTDPRIEAISFVGSTPIGEYIYQTGSAHGKRVQALCGAKNHMLVMPDADLDQAADAVMGAAYGSAGERCMAISVLVTTDDATADKMVALIKDRVANLNVGAYSAKGIEMGPIVSPQQLNKIRGYVDSGVEQGATLVVDGRSLVVEGHESGNFIGGCLFDNVTPDMKIYQEEIFGPVLSILRAGSYEEALHLINDHEYGNGTTIFTANGDHARDFTMRAKIGMVGVNVPIPVPVSYHSFGGWKRSLFGDHHMHGPEGIRFFTRLKTVTQRWPSHIEQGAVFNFHSGSEN